MRPAGLDYRSGKGWMIVHVCESCGRTNRTKAAFEDRRQPDDALSIAQLSGVPDAPVGLPSPDNGDWGQRVGLHIKLRPDAAGRRRSLAELEATLAWSNPLRDGSSPDRGRPYR